MSRLAVNQHPVLVAPDWQQPFHDATLLCLGRGLKVRGLYSVYFFSGETTDSSAIMIIVARAHSCYFVISSGWAVGCREGRIVINAVARYRANKLFDCNISSCIGIIEDYSAARVKSVAFCADSWREECASSDADGPW